MKADCCYGKESAAPVCAPEHLHPQLLATPSTMLHFSGGGYTDLIELSLELGFFDLPIAEAPESGLGSLFLALSHQPPRALGEEEERDGLDCRRSEEDGKRDTVGFLALHIVCRVVDGGTNDRPDAQLALIDAKDNAAKMGRRDLVDVDLGEGEEPPNGDTFVSSSVIFAADSTAGLRHLT
jgi:hypothetical protein